jgi:hypothetical protein
VPGLVAAAGAVCWGLPADACAGGSPATLAVSPAANTPAITTAPILVMAQKSIVTLANR